MPIITISRLAAGHGYHLTGPEDFKAAASRHDPEMATRLEHFFGEEGPSFFERLFFNTPAYVGLYGALVFELAAQGKVIIMGQCGRRIAPMVGLKALKEPMEPIPKSLSWAARLALCSRSSRSIWWKWVWNRGRSTW